MKLSQLIKELQDVFEEHGDIEAQIQTDPKHEGKGIVGDGCIYVLDEEYRVEDGGTICNLRTWPY